LKICPKLIASVLPALLIFTAVPALCQSRTPTRPRPAAQVRSQVELTALRALMKRVNEQSPRPPKVSATQVASNGYWENLELNVAWYGIMRRFCRRCAAPILS
jgi:hypothetical protein